MATSSASTVRQCLCRAALRGGGAGLTDEQLLAWYVERRDEAAFEAIVRRHGGLVMGVCRRILGNRHDAEDAFQATFLVLIRRAGAIAERKLLASWLFGVAQNMARKARSAAARLRTRERLVADLPEPVVEESMSPWADLRPLLDQELGRLPDTYRAPIILCDLEGKTRRQAAAQLDCPEGTVSSRLARGRELLAGRLARRGVALASGSLAAVFAQTARQPA